ncbi:cell division protein ZapE [Leeia oryzae]|uniref:cell division protein ZapE n=1 Tax=Leeia oryzae TaxID=356662 RepID=UPI00037AB77F|nr:cell division protein ZapE [Leeia oryzae]
MSQHAFSPDKNTHLSPAAWYGATLQQRGFHADEAQATAIAQLEALYQELLVFRQKRHRTFAAILPSPKLPKGLYMWGGVGRGKSFLMDAFFTCLPYKRKVRLHFHHFMFDIHAELKALKGEADPLITVADKLAKKYRVICFDEFHVSDIADAMILGRLMSALFERGVIFVMTSNYPPDQLYPNGLKRENFLPTIDLLNRELNVLNVDGGQDYRLRSLTKIPVYLPTQASETQQQLEEIFSSVATGKALKPVLHIEGRTLHPLKLAPGVVWFDFATLCKSARSQVDYLELARSNHTIILSSVPRMTSSMSSEARRFTWLVDVCYDQRVKLFISADVPASELYTEGSFANEFFRTISRLEEMQSKEYLALAHLG